MDDVFEPKSIVVTTGCGFIGSSFAHHAERECPGTHVTVTHNGRNALIVMTPETYDGLKSEWPTNVSCADWIVRNRNSISANTSMTTLPWVRCRIDAMLKFAISRSAAWEILSIAQYLEDEFGSPGKVRSFIQEFKHQAEPTCSFPL